MRMGVIKMKKPTMSGLSHIKLKNAVVLTSSVLWPLIWSMPSKTEWGNPPTYNLPEIPGWVKSPSPL
jgi:hypothetical protein